MKVLTSLPKLSELGFGLHYCPLMAMAEYKNGGWSPLRITPMQSLALHPGAKVLHYAQEIFEGLKAFRHENGNIALFRPQMNIARMTRSAQLMSMPPFPEKEFLSGIRDLVAKSKDFVPGRPGALYLRPTMIATSVALGVAPSSEYLFYVVLCPVGGYFGAVDSGTAAKIRLWVSDSYVRAVRGGVGSAKTGANYAASLTAVQHAKKLGFDNVLFLDALERKNIEEMSGMNVFFVEDGVLCTPPLGDTILNGVTRDSIISIAKQKNIKVIEKHISIDHLIKRCEAGDDVEFFACGTGASITAVSELSYKGKTISVRGKDARGAVGPITHQLYTELLGIQFGNQAPPTGHDSSAEWIVNV